MKTCGKSVKAMTAVLQIFHVSLHYLSKSTQTLTVAIWGQFFQPKKEVCIIACLVKSFPSINVKYCITKKASLFIQFLL